ncbi:MAG: biopolymer transporter ExbD [Planctomycetes bacterium]|nr:biopolymer transporter ExbD [Planctomycetota bacterium]
MGRFREGLNDSDEAAIDMSPLIDCVFILLIFFIVTTVFVEESGLPAVQPEPSANANPTDEESKTVVFQVSADGTIRHEGRDIGLHGVGPTVARRIQKEMVPVVIQAERKAKAGIMIGVLDAAMAAGAEDVSVDARN